MRSSCVRQRCNAHSQLQTAASCCGWDIPRPKPPKPPRCTVYGCFFCTKIIWMCFSLLVSNSRTHSMNNTNYTLVFTLCNACSISWSCSYLYYRCRLDWTELLKRPPLSELTMPGSTSPHHDQCGHLFCRKSKTKNNSWTAWLYFSIWSTHDTAC
jgi:hypothetical protein